MSPTRPLERELAFFNSKRKEWLQHYLGKFALVKEDRLVETFSTFAEAYSAGVDQFGPDAFLVRQINEQDREQSVPALFVGALFACPQ